MQCSPSFLEIGIRSQRSDIECTYRTVIALKILRRKMLRSFSLSMTGCINLCYLHPKLEECGKLLCLGTGLIAQY